jgi:hypothetical protein
MSQMPEHPITALIRAAASRSAQESADLAATLARGSRQGAGDRVDPVAIEWLRRWAPSRMPFAGLECACAAGRCAHCN